MQVSFVDYARCVEAQVEFLIEFGGVSLVRPLTHPDVRECWERNVSVDACAASLTM